MIRIGIDLGGTKIEGVALDERGEIAIRHRLPTPAGNYQAILDTVVGLVRKIETETQWTCPVGIATPGAISPKTGRIKNSNSVCLNDKPLLEDLQQLLARPLKMANDADCFALSEAIDGAGAGSAVVFGVIVGTGTGAGIVAHGRLLQGPNAIAGEWGHNPLPWSEESEQPGPECYCGKRGCIETFLSGPGLAADFLRRGGPTCSAGDIVAAAESGDKLAESVLRDYEDRMARSLAHVINILDPDVIVLGGGMSNVGRLYHNVPRLWDEYVFSDDVRTQLLPPRFGDSSGVRGAAWLWEGG